MATYTSYLNLEKPTTSETFNLLKMNQNWDKIDAGVSSLNSNINTTNYSSDITTGTGENNAFCRCLKTGNVVQLTFQGNSRTHTENEILCTVPSALRPNYTTYHIGAINGASCVIQMSSSGDAKLYALYGNTSDARVYFNATYVIGG